MKKISLKYAKINRVTLFCEENFSHQILIFGDFLARAEMNNKKRTPHSPEPDVPKP
jgi:hypothetical protein